MTGSGALCVVSYLLALPFPGSGSGAGWLRPLRPVRGNYVARDLQPCGGKMSKGRNGHVCLFALAGDLGCSSGPTLVGMISDAFDGRLTAGLLAAIIFPLLLLAGLRLCKK